MRYRLVCVAPEIPDLMSTYDLDEACINATAHYEVWDSVEREDVGPNCQEDYDYHMDRYRVKQAMLYWPRLAMLEG